MSDNPTPLEAQEESNLGTVPDKNFLTGDSEWDETLYADYATVRIPDESERPRWEWATEERRAELFRLLRKYGHPDNLPKKQGEYGKEFGVTQQCISNDIKVLRKYIAAHAGHEAISNTKMIVERARAKLLEEDPKGAVEVQMKFNEFLFDLGELDREPDRKEIASVTANTDLGELDEDERKPFDALAEKMRDVNDVDDEEPIDVESGEVTDDE